MRALIISKTHMSSMACVGAIDMTTNTCIRLMTADGYNQPGSTHFEVGEIWEIDYVKRAGIHRPHVEDVVLRKAQYVGPMGNVVEYVKSSSIPIWKGNPECLFDGHLDFTSNGTGSASPASPRQSVGFWIPDKDLVRNDYQGNIRYAYRPYNGSFSGQKTLKFVGFQEPLDVIPAGTLLRVSLTRPWSPTPGETLKCWLQLSGWYGIEQPVIAISSDDDNDLPF